MPEFQSGDIVRVEMPRGYSMRGVLGISVLFSTSPESRFEGAIGTVTDINPLGPQSVHQYLVDFRTHDNSKVGLPWQAQWFREEWIALRERPEVTTSTARSQPEATWPERPEAAANSPGIAHPQAKLFTEGRRDFAPEGFDPSTDAGRDLDTAPDVAHPESKLYGQGQVDFAPPPMAPESDPAATLSATTPEESLAFTGANREDDRSASDVPAFKPTAETMARPVDTTTPSSAPGAMGADVDARPSSDLIVERGEGFVRVRGMSICPDGFPIKGAANSGVFHVPTDSSYQRTVPEICFATEDVAIINGYRPPAQPS